MRLGYFILVLISSLCFGNNLIAQVCDDFELNLVTTDDLNAFVCSGSNTSVTASIDVDPSFETLYNYTFSYCIGGCDGGQFSESFFNIMENSYPYDLFNVGGGTQKVNVTVELSLTPDITCILQDSIPVFNSPDVSEFTGFEEQVLEVCTGDTVPFIGAFTAGAAFVNQHYWYYVSGNDSVSLSDSQNFDFNTSLIDSANTNVHYTVTDENGCSDDGFVQVGVNFSPLVFINGSENLSICADSTSLPLTAVVTSNNVSFEWTSEPSGIIDINEENILSAEVDAIMAGETDIYLTILDTLENCPANDIVHVVVNEYPDIMDAINVSLPMDNDSLTYCQGDSIIIGFPNPNSSYIYTWTPTGDTELPNDNTTLTIAVAGMDNSQPYTISVSNNGCISEESIPLAIVNDSLAFNDVNLPEEVCSNDGIVNFATNILGGSYTIEPTSESLSNDGIFNTLNGDSGSYNIMYMYSPSESSCSFNISHQITVHENPEIIFNNLSTNDTMVCSNQSLMISVVELEGEISYVWNYFDPILNAEIQFENDTLLFPQIDTMYTGHYFIEVTNDTSLCKSTDSIQINVIDQEVLLQWFSSLDTVVCGNSDPFLLNPNILGGTYTVNNMNADQSPALNIENNSFDPSLVPIGNYEIKYAVMVSDCIFETSHIITLIDFPLPSINSDSSSYCSGGYSLFYVENVNDSSSYSWDINVGDTISFSDQQILLVQWPESGSFELILREQKVCESQTVLPINLVANNDQSPVAEIYHSELNDILYYNDTPGCYQWGYFDPNPGPSENFYVELDSLGIVDVFHEDSPQINQSYVVGDFKQDRIYWCKAWSIDLDPTCSNSECSKMSIFTKNNSAEIKEIGFDFKIYPNPSNGLFYLEASNLFPNVKYLWRIYDSYGRVVLTKDFMSTDTKIRTNFQLPDVRSGLYYLGMYRDEQLIKSTKFIIQKD